MYIIDFHTHILPGADHGSNGVKTSIKQLNMAKKAGVDCIIATPHFYPHRHLVEQFLRRRDAAYRELISNENYNGPEIKLAAEVLLCSGLENLEGLSSLCLFGTNTLLLELPFTDHKEEHIDSVNRLIKDGYDIIIAHADRYSSVIIDKFIDLGVKLQLNADSLDTLVKKKHLYKWMQDGLVVGFGSDIHGTNRSAYKHFMRLKNKPCVEFYNDIMQASNSIWSKIKIYPD